MNNPKWLLICLLLVSLTTSSFSQELAKSYLFDLPLLQRFAKELKTNDDVIPVFDRGKFVYVNAKTRNRISTEKFEEAYPFLKEYAIVKKDGKYGVINKQIAFVVPPSFQDAYTFLDGKWISHDKDYDVRKIFSFENGKIINDTITNRYADTGEPMGPQIFFKKSGEKFYLTFNQLPSYQTEPIYDTVFMLDNDNAAVKISGKIGVVDGQAKMVAPIEYSNIIMGVVFVYDYSARYALKKGECWSYYWGGKKLFDKKEKPDKLYRDVFTYRIGNLYNYFNTQVVKMLPVNYKYIYPSGNLAINVKNQLVLLNNENQEFIYFEL